MSEQTVVITKKEYAKLKKDSEFLEALYCAGVDNWEGISQAHAFINDDED